MVKNRLLGKNCFYSLFFYFGKYLYLEWSMRRNEFPFIAINSRLWDNNTLCIYMYGSQTSFGIYQYNTNAIEYVSLYYIEQYSKQKIIRLLS